jgi:hypothetical protein
MSHRFSIVRIKEQTHPQDFSRLYLVQIAVDDVPCTPFFSHEIQRRELGEQAWLLSLYDNAEMLVREYGRAPVMT